VSPEPRIGALVGTVLGGVYRITGLIGEGGMGAVYEAVQFRLNKRVAVKLMAHDSAPHNRKGPLCRQRLSRPLPENRKPESSR
jgi:serine/threonine protein kinase